MRPTANVLVIVLVTCLPLLSACRSPAVQPEQDEPKQALPGRAASMEAAVEYDELAKSGAGTVYALDPVHSRVRIHVFRGGAAAKAGHNHVFAAPTFEGLAYVSTAGVGKSRFDIRVRLDQLLVDDPAWRKEVGGAFAGERSATDIAGTLRNMLGERGLDARRYPFVHLKSLSIAGDWPYLVAETAITLHDRTVNHTVLLTARTDGNRLTASGSLVLRQSDFGITPFTVLGGLLAVQDAVAVSFDLAGTTVP